MATQVNDIYDRQLFRYFYVSYCFPRYSFKNNIAGDLTAGMTVAVMHIPQGMQLH